MPQKIVATGMLAGYDGEGRAQSRRGVRFGIRQTSVQVRDRGPVREVDGEERRTKDLGQSRRQPNANLHRTGYFPFPSMRAAYHKILYQGEHACLEDSSALKCEEPQPPARQGPFV